MGVPLAQAAQVGRRVLAGLARGRQRAIRQSKERSARHVATILILVNEDRRRGRPDRGRAGRIARRMGGVLTERRIRQILRETLFNGSHSQGDNSLKKQEARYAH
jgi:hypothetical protein